jgi:hypothetical protein
VPPARSLLAFGNDANATMKAWAGSVPDDLYKELVRKAERAIKTKPRARPENIKQRVVVERGFEDIRLAGEDVVDFEYRPEKCKHTYRVVAVRKNLSHEKSELVLLEEVRYFFYITNDLSLSCDEVVREANRRCNQENLIEQLKNGVRSLHAGQHAQHAQRELGVHGDGVARLEPQGLGRADAAHPRALARASRRRAEQAPAHGVPHVSGGVHQRAVSDPAQRSPAHLPAAGVDPLAARVLPVRRLDLKATTAAGREGRGEAVHQLCATIRREPR